MVSRNICRSGSIRFREDTGWWVVVWYDPVIKRGRDISWFRGRRMYDRKEALRLLYAMQSDVEEGTFRIEKYAKKNWGDVISFFEIWLDTKEKARNDKRVSFLFQKLDTTFLQR